MPRFPIYTELFMIAEEPPEPARPTYPAARRMDQVDDYHGTSIADPYRWLEDTDSAETSAWIDAQNELTESHLRDVPQRAGIRARLEQLWDSEKFGIPFTEGGRTFFLRGDGLQDQSVLWVMDGPDAEPRVLLDPNLLSDDGTVALKGTSVSPDGKLLAYGLSEAGSDWETWRVRDVESCNDLDDQLDWVKFSGASWARDSSGFYYSRYAAPVEGQELAAANYDQKLCFHRVGEPQSADDLVYERPDEREWGFGAHVTDDDRYLVVSVWRGTHRENAIFCRDRSVADAPMVELLGGFDARYQFLGNDGSVFLVKTSRDAPRDRIVAIDLESPAPDNWKTLVPETDDTLHEASYVGGHVVASYLHHAHSRVRVHARDGAWVRDVELPGIGTTAGFHGADDDPQSYFAYFNFFSPPTIYRYDVATGELAEFRRPDLDVAPERFEVKQVFATSKDGTQVPLFIAHLRGLELDGRNPTYLYGYGGFNAALTPEFRVANVVWMEMGGVYVVANLRGGGEYGRDWYQAGTKERKQNVFDDFIAAAEWLIDADYTSTPKLSIGGGSNGGLLVGACLTQRPDLYAACVAAVGVFDMLRYHRFTIGWAWASDFGTADDPEGFEILHAYSPLHNLREGTAYPATLIATGDHDDRVVPGHSFKFAAALQHCQAGTEPTLIRVERSAGHGLGKPVAKVIDESADRLAFLVRALGL